MSIYVFKKIDKTENFTNELKSIQKQKKNQEEEYGAFKMAE